MVFFSRLSTRWRTSWWRNTLTIRTLSFLSSRFTMDFYCLLDWMKKIWEITSTITNPSNTTGTHLTATLKYICIYVNLPSSLDFLQGRQGDPVEDAFALCPPRADYNPTRDAAVGQDHVSAGESARLGLGWCFWPFRVPLSQCAKLRPRTAFQDFGKDGKVQP